jgi:hypothetical protein
LAFAGDATPEGFSAGAKTLKAVAADLMIIGEAANHVPEDVFNARDAEPNRSRPQAVTRLRSPKMNRFEIHPEAVARFNDRAEALAGKLSDRSVPRRLMGRDLRIGEESQIPE